jgi:hypothetical protein
MAQVRQQQAPYQVQQPQPQQYNQPAATYTTLQQPQFPQQQQQLPYAQQMPQVPQAPPQVTMENLFESMKFWKGGQAHKVDREPCPNCGSGQYYSRQVGRRGPPPAPHCYNCGYNDGMFTQGEATTWGMTG